MRLVFKKLRTPASTIKVSFDGETYRIYDVNTIKNQGYIEFTEQDCPDLTKLKIQGQFSTIDSVEVNKNILIEGNSEGILYNYEKPVYNEVHYYCFAWDSDNNGEISEDEKYDFHHAWLKDEIADNMELYTTDEPGIPKSIDDLFTPTDDGYGYVSLLNNDKTKLATIWLQNSNLEGTTEITVQSEPDYGFVRYSAGDLIGYEPTSEIESLSDIIVEIQEEPTITENGKYYAEDGKAFKSVNVNVDIDLGFKCFYSGAEFFNFPGQNPDMSLQGLSFICNIMISYKYAENLYHQLFPNGRYNNIIGIRYYDPKQNPVEYWYTIVNEYELLSFDCLNGIGTISFLFLEHNPYEGYTENPGIIEIALSSGRVINRYDPAPLCQ